MMQTCFNFFFNVTRGINMTREKNRYIDKPKKKGKHQKYSVKKIIYNTSKLKTKKKKIIAQSLMM
jgi:hypothetical protein